MAVTIGIPREIEERETRVAAVPAAMPKLLALGAEVLVEEGAGLASHADDDAYREAGARVVPRDEALDADLVAKVAMPTEDEAGRLRHDAVLVGMLAPYRNGERLEVLRARGVTPFSLELLPRITRAQPMDVLSSQAAISGQKAALMAACALGRLLPMITTAVGTVRPAKVVVLGAGVAGLQAIATAHRLGAVVEAYDVRRATKEQVQSVGGRFIDLPIDAEAAGGYARELSDEERRVQEEALAGHIVAADAVITTAAVPGKPAPKLIPTALVDRMKRGAVIIDLAAEGGGNCEASRPGGSVDHDGVTIFAPLNVPALLPEQASDMYARNVANFLALLVRDGELQPDWDDEIVAATAVGGRPASSAPEGSPAGDAEAS